MTGEDPEAKKGAEDDLHENDPMSALLKRSLSSAEKATPPPRDLLRGVQKRIRVRSRGKFYADGWSTSTSRVSYMLIAALMLLAVALAYFALGPMGVSTP